MQPFAWPSAEECSLDVLSSSLDRLERARFQHRPRLPAACEACIAQDRRTTFAEAETMCAIADALDCPMPPILGEYGTARPGSDA